MTHTDGRKACLLKHPMQRILHARLIIKQKLKEKHQKIMCMFILP